MSYYYAGGKRQELEPVNDRLAIDARGAEDPGLRDEIAALPVESRLPAGLILVDRGAVGEQLQERLRAKGLARPVYRSGRALVVLMPEVRVEVEGGQHAAALAAIHAAPVAAEVIEDTGDRLSLRPRSGRGEDALDLANFVYERAHPAASSVRMLQVVPRPISGSPRTGRGGPTG